MMLGDLEVELDEEKVLVKLTKCLTCHRLPPTGSAMCDFERGLVDGVLERITGTDVITKETLCWGLGDTVCQFEAYNSAADGYVYAEDGSQREVQRRLLTGIADQSDIALENLRLVGDQRYAETRDPLTGMYNFRHLREHAALELARARRHERTVAFVMLDIDGFATVNEAVGEEAGDHVLRQWADQLRGLLRECDLTCRYGADEFLLVLPETGDAQADLALARLRAALGEMVCEAGGRSFTLTRQRRSGHLPRRRRASSRSSSPRRRPPCTSPSRAAPARSASTRRPAGARQPPGEAAGRAVDGPPGPPWRCPGREPRGSVACRARASSDPRRRPSRRRPAAGLRALRAADRRALPALGPRGARGPAARPRRGRGAARRRPPAAARPAGGRRRRRARRGRAGLRQREVRGPPAGLVAARTGDVRGGRLAGPGRRGQGGGRTSCCRCRRSRCRTSSPGWCWPNSSSAG